MSTLTAGIFLPAGSNVEPQQIFVEDYKSIQSMIGGNFDVVRTDMGQPDVALVGYVHDEGLLLDLEYNFLATALFKQELHGDCVVVWGLSPNGVYDGDNYDVPSHIAQFLQTELLAKTSDAYNMATSVSFALSYAIATGIVDEDDVDRIVLGLYDNAGTKDGAIETELSNILKMVVVHAKDNTSVMKDFLDEHIKEMLDAINNNEEEGI